MSVSSLALINDTYERKMTLYELFDEYLSTLKKTTATTYQFYINDFKYFVENKELQEVTVNDIQTYINYKITANLKDVTVFQYFSMINTIFNYAVSHNYLDTNPCENVKVKRVYRSAPRNIDYSKRYIKKLLKLFKKTKLQSIVLVAVHTRNEKSRIASIKKRRY